MAREVDELLQAYLHETELPVSQEARAGQQAERPEVTAAVSPGPNAELKALIESYLEVVEGERAVEFAAPRSQDVDELLRRYVLDQEDVSGELESTLRQHLTTEESTVLAGEVSPAVNRVAARLVETADLDQRLSRYASAFAEEDEKQHAFSDDHESTLKGLPPPNSPPIPLGSALARDIRRKSSPAR
jgi:hypothetical protein